MPFAPVNGIDQYYESHGEGVPVVFAHGRGGNHLSWWQQVAAFRSRYRCITFDHREFGQSREVPEGPGRSAFAEDLLGLLDHLGIQRAILVGQSMGGGTVMQFAVRYPERVIGMVLSDTPGGLNDERQLADFRRRAPGLPADATLRALSASFKQADPAKTFLYAQIGALAPQPRENFVQYITATDGPTTEEVGRLRVPALVINGADDIVITPDNAAYLCKCIPGARLEVVADAGHSVYWERPAVFNALLEQFIQGLPAN